MTDPLADSLLGYLRNQRSAMVELLQHLARVESPSDTPAAIAPVLDLLTGELKRSRMSVRRLRGQTSAGMLLARSRSRSHHGPMQLLVGHCDTVWPVGTLKQMPVCVEGDTIKGPGVLDMKGGLVQMVFALRVLSELDLQPAVRPLALITSDEETGSTDSTPIIRQLARRACRAFVLEPAYGRDGKLKTARKGVGTFTITITGRPAHAGLNPEQGVSAVLELSHQIQRLFSLNDPARGITVNVGTIGGGVRPNVVAPEVTASVDVRVRTMADAEEVTTAIRGLRPVNPQTSLRIEGGIEHPPLEPLPRNQALWRLAQRLGNRVGLELGQAEVGGASDGNTTSQHTATLDGLGAVGDGAHAFHEQVDARQLVQRCALLALLLLAPVERPPGQGEREP